MRRAAIIASVLILGMGQASAGSRNWLPAAVGIGAIVGGALIVNELNKPKKPPPQVYRPPAQPAAPRAPVVQTPEQAERAALKQQRERERAEQAQLALDTNKDLQTRLTTLGYNTGGTSGKWGPKSSAAARAFQAELGHTVTGKLTADETSELYRRTSQPVVASPAPAPAPVPAAPAAAPLQPLAPPAGTYATAPNGPPPLPGESTLPEPVSALGPVN